MFSVGSYFKIWGVVDKGNYAEVECSTSKKIRQTGNYEVDFSSKFVRFFGNAYRRNPQEGQKIKVTNCGVQNVYEKDGRRNYLKNPTFCVFDYELEGDEYTPTAYGGNSGGFTDVEDLDEGLPF